MNLLIIDDKAEMIELIQKQFALINEEYSVNNTYCFSSEVNKLNIKRLNDIDQLNDISFSVDTIQSVIKKIDKFINKRTDSVFIVIDMCLKSDHLGTYDVEDYYENDEYSAEIYKHLIELKNSNTKYNDVYFMIYSRSETFVEIFSKVLKNLHQKLVEEKKNIENFPYESCEAFNMTWCINLWRSGVTNNEKPADKTFPLCLSEGIVDFIENL